MNLLVRLLVLSSACPALAMPMPSATAPYSPAGAPVGVVAAPTATPFVQEIPSTVEVDETEVPEPTISGNEEEEAGKTIELGEETPASGPAAAEPPAMPEPTATTGAIVTVEPTATEEPLVTPEPVSKTCYYEDFEVQVHVHASGIVTMRFPNGSISTPLPGLPDIEAGRMKALDALNMGCGLSQGPKTEVLLQFTLSEPVDLSLWTSCGELLAQASPIAVIVLSDEGLMLCFMSLYDYGGEPGLPGEDDLIEPIV